MKLSEYKHALEKIEFILKKFNRNNYSGIYKALLDACPGQVPPDRQFIDAYHTEITARQLLRALYPKNSPQELQKLRQPSSITAKHGNRKDPLEVRLPKRKVNNWRENYRDPTCILLESIGDTKLVDMCEKDVRLRYETTGNMLFVLKAFFHRVDQLTGALSETTLQSAKPEEKAYTLHDGGGLYLVVSPDGTKQWYFKMCRQVKTRKKAVEVDSDFAKQWHVETRIKKWRSKHFGDYPQTTLHYARCYREAANKLLDKRKYPFSKKNNIETIIDCIYDDEKDVPIPAWMAQVLADGFKHYYSRRFLSGKKNTTLDDVFGIKGKIRYGEIDNFSIDNTKLVDEARKMQWYCNLKFAPALEFALRKIKLEYAARGDNLEDQEIYRFTHAELKTICEDEPRNKYGSYAAWYKKKEFSFLAGHLLRESFLDLIEALDECHKTNLKTEIETAMKDPHKRQFRLKAILPSDKSL